MTPTPRVLIVPGLHESGFGPFPLALRWVEQARQQAAREARPHHAAWQEWFFAV